MYVYMTYFGLKVRSVFISFLEPNYLIYGYLDPLGFTSSFSFDDPCFKLDVGLKQSKPLLGGCWDKLATQNWACETLLVGATHTAPVM